MNEKEINKLIYDAIDEHESSSGFLNSLARIKKLEMDERAKKIFIPIIDCIQYFVGMLNPIVDCYYKSENTKSIEIFIEDAVKAHIEGLKNNSIKRLLLTKAVKNSYIVKNNINFIKSINENDLLLKFSFLNKKDFEEITHSISFELFYITMRSAGVEIRKIKNSKKNLDESSYEINDALIVIANKLSQLLRLKYYIPSERGNWSEEIYNTGASEIILNNKIPGAYSSRTMPIDFYIKIILNPKTAFNDSPAAKLKLKELAKSIAIKKGNNKKQAEKLSTIANAMFERELFVRSIVNKSTETKTYTTINPLTGYKAIKTRRVYKENDEISEESSNTFLNDFLAINSMYEESSSILKSNESKINDNMNKCIKVVSGDDIVAAYNVSSYRDVSYNYISNDFSHNIAGPIGQSCMRYTCHKEKIQFYANNPKIVKLITCSVNGDKYIDARAIMWWDEEKKSGFVDRIYYNSNKSLAIIRTFIKNSPNISSIHSSTAGDCKFTEKFAIKIDEINGSNDMPYLDSMQKKIFIGENGAYIGTADGVVKIYKEDLSKMKTIESFSNFKYNKENSSSKISIEKMTCNYCGRKSYSGIKNERGSFVCDNHILMYNNKLIVGAHGTSLNLINTKEMNFNSMDKISDSNLLLGTLSTRISNRVLTKVSDNGVLELYDKNWRAEEVKSIFKLLTGNNYLQQIIYNKTEDTDFSKEITFDMMISNNNGKLLRPDKVYYDKKTVKKILIEDKPVLVPINMDKNQKNILYSIFCVLNFRSRYGYNKKAAIRNKKSIERIFNINKIISKNSNQIELVPESEFKNISEINVDSGYMPNSSVLINSLKVVSINGQSIVSSIGIALTRDGYMSLFIPIDEFSIQLLNDEEKKQSQIKLKEIWTQIC